MMAYVPFEDLLSAGIFTQIEKAYDKEVTDFYRVFPVKQEQLLLDGCKIKEKDEKKKTLGPLIKSAKYIGNKWGGKYLRAPDIYWTILDKGRDKLVRLGDIAEVRRGFTTGVNEFFYLDDEKIKRWGIEMEFLKPIIKSPRECKRILINTKDLKFKIFLCHKDKKDLKDTAALEYIKWGEKQGFNNRPSCLGRQRWWELEVLIPKFIERSTFNRNHDFPYNKAKVIIDKVMYGVNPYKTYNDVSIGLSLNSAVTGLQIELYGSLGLGLGALFISVEDSQNKLCVIEPSLIPNGGEDILNNFYNGTMERFHISCKQNNRIALDALIFDALGLTQGERDAVYEGVINLVEARLSKASSLDE